MRKSSIAVTLGVTALVAASVSACGSDEGSGYDEVDADYAQVCRDDDTGKRLDDSDCLEKGYAASTTTSPAAAHGGGSGGGYRSSHSHWYFIPLSGGRSVPAVGSSLSGGESYPPAGSRTTTVRSGGGSYAKSGSVSRGGFGGDGGKGGSKGG